MTVAPSAANCLAMPAPIPFDAPVTTATFPFSFPFFIFVSFIFGLTREARIPIVQLSQPWANCSSPPANKGGIFRYLFGDRGIDRRYVSSFGLIGAAALV